MGWKDYYIAASGCAAASCPTGQKANSAHTGCETITCPSGKHLVGDDCVYSNLCKNTGVVFYSSFKYLSYTGKQCTMERTSTKDTVYGSAWGSSNPYLPVIQTEPGIINSMYGCNSVIFNVPITINGRYINVQDGSIYWVGDDNATFVVPAGTPIRMVAPYSIAEDRTITLGSC